MISTQPAAAEPSDAAKSFDVKPLAIEKPIPRAVLDPPVIDLLSFRERQDKVLKRAGITTQEEAMEFSLAFWEKRRKVYFS